MRDAKAGSLDEDELNESLLCELVPFLALFSTRRRLRGRSAPATELFPASSERMVRRVDGAMLCRRLLLGVLDEDEDEDEECQGDKDGELSRMGFIAWSPARFPWMLPGEG